MKKPMSPKGGRRFGGPKNHALREKSDRSSPTSFRTRAPRRDEDDWHAGDAPRRPFRGPKRGPEEGRFKPNRSTSRRAPDDRDDERSTRREGRHDFGHMRRPPRDDAWEGREDRPRRFDERSDRRPEGDRPRRHHHHDEPRRPYGDRPRTERSYDKPRRDDRRHDDHAPKRRDHDRTGRDKRPAAEAAPPPRGRYVWGLHAVREAWLNPARKCFRLLMTEAAQESLTALFDETTAKDIVRPTPKVVAREALDALLPEGSVHQGVVLDAAPLPELTLTDLLEKTPSLIVLLDQVTDPHNVGAILRSAAAFGAEAVIMTERNAPQATGVMGKVACGGMEHVALISVTNLARTLETLGEAGFTRVGLAEEGEQDLSACDLGSGKTVLVLGAEGTGLRRLTRENCDALARLPTQPPIGSLNVSNAAAVALYEVERQRRAKA
jgi:23S rRNA (guanosine2251-2'-O)-methyltransferase